MRRAHRLDGSHAAIVAEFTARGATVLSLAGIGSGCPDVLVGYRQQMRLVELKDGSKPASKRKLTTLEVDFQNGWRGTPVLVINCVEDVAAVLEAMS